MSKEAVGKKVRFEVFKRDNFTCAYCGNTPPTVILEVDHIDPVSKGGLSVIENLITSCFSCNRGKGNRLLTTAPPKIDETIQQTTEKENQILEYRKFITAIKRREKRDAKKIEKIYHEAHPEWYFSENFMKITVYRFLKMLPLHVVEEAMRIACTSRKVGHDPDKTLKYFCGVCWGKFNDRMGN